jgi:hypothetical protein
MRATWRIGAELPSDPSIEVIMHAKAAAVKTAIN